MKFKDLMEKVEDFFDLSKKKQKEKSNKLKKIIKSLQDKKDDLRKEIKQEARKDKKSKNCYNLCKEYKVVNRLLKKAKQHASH